MLVPLRRAYSEGKEFINQNTYEFDVRPHTARDTHTATQRPPQLQCVCGRECVWRVVQAGDRAGHQSEMISEPEREAQIKLVQCQCLGGLRELEGDQLCPFRPRGLWHRQSRLQLWPQARPHAGAVRAGKPPDKRGSPGHARQTTLPCSTSTKQQLPVRPGNRANNGPKGL